MKKYLLSIALMFLFCVNVVFAQKTAEQRAEHRSQNLAKNVGLSADQTKKVYDIHLNTIKQIEVIKQEPKGKKGGHGGKIKQLNKERNTQVLAVFTPEQKTKYDQWQASKKDKKANKGNGKGKKMKDDDDDDND